MTRKIPIYFFFLAILLATEGLRAQDLPSFPTDKAIAHSFLPNGAEYFLVQNKEALGYADFALVQKNHVNEKEARKMLVSLPDFGSVSPAAFLSSKGIAYSPDGFVSELEGSTVFSFRNIPVYDGATPDSTLLILFNIMRRTDASQAIIISGDVDMKQISDRMYAMSMTVPRLTPSAPFPPYEWKDRDRMETEVQCGRMGELAKVSVSFRSARTPAKYMNTPQPLVTRMLASELGTVLSSRIRTLFREQGIPLASVSFIHKDSRMTRGDEVYTVEVQVGEDSAQRAAEMLGGVLGELGSKGAALDEFRDARETLVWNSSNSTGLPTNRQYVDRCIKAYLFGAALVKESAERDFFSRHRLSLDRELGLLNNFTSQLLHSPSAAELICRVRAGAVDADALAIGFKSAWEKSALDTSAVYYPSFSTDTLVSILPKKKVKVKSEVPDPVTGGELWTFTNGMKVVYRQTSEIDGFEYALMIRGGFSGIRDLNAGESAFVEDMLSLCKVGGLPSSAFSGMLAANGIRMKTEVSASDMRIYGSAPVTKLQLLLKSLLALSSERGEEPNSLDLYRKEEGLRLAGKRMTPAELSAISDSLMNPGYRYSRVKRIGNLSETLPSKAETYFESQFSRCSDGILVFVGNLGKENLQKMLCRYLGEFKTSKTSSVRQRVQYRQATGWHTYSFDSSVSGNGPDSECVSLAMAVAPPFNMGSYMTFKITAVAVEKAMARELASVGMCPTVESRFEIIPSDRLCLNILIQPCRESGLPAGIKPAYPGVGLDAARSALVKACKSGISAGELKACKAELKARLSSELKSPESLCAASVTRHSLGRDLVSHYSEYVDAVSAQDVVNMLKSFNDGVKIEVISR